MKNRLIAALLIVSLTGRSVAPRAAPTRAATSEPIAVGLEPEQASAAGNAPDPEPASSERQKAIGRIVLLVFLAVLTVALVRGVSNSIANNCCYR